MSRAAGRSCLSAHPPLWRRLKKSLWADDVALEVKQVHAAPALQHVADLLQRAQAAGAMRPPKVASTAGKVKLPAAVMAQSLLHLMPAKVRGCMCA
jgi:hypothetical protein